MSFEEIKIYFSNFELSINDCIDSEDMFETYVSYYLVSQGLNLFEDFDLMDSIDFSADFNDILTSVGLKIPDSYDGTFVQKLYTYLPQGNSDAIFPKLTP